MFLEAGALAFGILISFFLKDINFLGLNFGFIGTGIIYPDFLLLFVIFFALHKREFSGIWLGFFAGILEDSGMLTFSTVQKEFLPIIGVHALIYTVTGFIIGNTSRFIDKTHIVPQMLLVFGAILIMRILVWLLMGVLDQFNNTYSFFWPALYTSLLTPIWFTMLKWLYRVYGDEEV
jgi:rod shape-determining protein MreD